CSSDLALEPAAAGCRRDDVAVAVDDVEVDRVAARAGGLADARSDGAGDGTGKTGIGPAGSQLQGCLVADEGAPLVGVLAAEEEVERNVDEIGVSVPRLPVRERELGAFDDGVDEVGARDAHPGEVKAFEERQLLEEDGALSPRPGLEDRV